MMVGPTDQKITGIASFGRGSLFFRHLLRLADPWRRHSNRADEKEARSWQERQAAFFARCICI